MANHQVKLGNLGYFFDFKKKIIDQVLKAIPYLDLPWLLLRYPWWFGDCAASKEAMPSNRIFHPSKAVTKKVEQWDEDDDDYWSYYYLARYTDDHLVIVAFSNYGQLPQESFLKRFIPATLHWKRCLWVFRVFPKSSSILPLTSKEQDRSKVEYWGFGFRFPPKGFARKTLIRFIVNIAKVKLMDLHWVTFQANVYHHKSSSSIYYS